MSLDQMCKQQCLKRNVKYTNVITAYVFRTNVITTHIHLKTNTLEKSVS